MNFEPEPSGEEARGEEEDLYPPSDRVRKPHNVRAMWSGVEDVDLQIRKSVADTLGEGEMKQLAKVMLGAGVLISTWAVGQIVTDLLAILGIAYSPALLLVVGLLLVIAGEELLDK